MSNPLPKLKALVRKYRLVLLNLPGLLLSMWLAWELFKTGPMGDAPVEFRAGALIFITVLTLVWGVRNCFTPDKSAIKPQWWR